MDDGFLSAVSAEPQRESENGSMCTRITGIDHIECAPMGYVAVGYNDHQSCSSDSMLVASVRIKSMFTTSLFFHKIPKYRKSCQILIPIVQGVTSVRH